MPLLLLQPLTCAKGECRTPTAAAALDSGCLPLMQSQCTGGEHPAVVALLLCHSLKGKDVTAAAAAVVAAGPLPAQVQHCGCCCCCCPRQPAVIELLPTGAALLAIHVAAVAAAPAAATATAPAAAPVLIHS